MATGKGRRANPGRTSALVFVLGLLLLAAGAPARAATVTVFAAASLTDSLKEIAAGYEKKSGDQIVFNFAGSGLLARQLEEGAPADIFFSADEAKVSALEAKGLLVKNTRRSRLSNTLVIVTSLDSSLDLRSAQGLLDPRIKRLAVGEPRTVPAGTYAREYLAQLGLWQRLQDKVVPLANVRSVLAVVEAGNAEAGIVYRTDAARSRKVKTAFEVPAADGPRISYPMAMLKASRQPREARQFLDHLSGGEAGQVFARFGFLLLPPEPR